MRGEERNAEGRERRNVEKWERDVRGDGWRRGDER